jgi:hypothetical protein
MTLTRIYIPLNASGLRGLDADGTLGGAPFLAHAVTEAVRACAPTAGRDEWEYAALNDAAKSSGSLLASGESRRIVAAADVTSDLVGSAAPDGSTVESAVSILDSVALQRIASFHVGDGVSTDNDLDDELDDELGDELQWYDVTELPVILAFL